jgi:regulatory protein
LVLGRPRLALVSFDALSDAGSDRPHAADADTERRRALDLAGKALSSRDRTVAEMRAHLERKRVDPGTIDAAIAELGAAGHLDDERFARHFTDEKRSLSRWGSERIAHDLARRGIPRELVDAALADLGAENELEAARELLVERFGDGLGTDRDRDRAWRLLVRRGYQPELAYEAVRTQENAEKHQ